MPRKNICYAALVSVAFTRISTGVGFALCAAAALLLFELALDRTWRNEARQRS